MITETLVLIVLITVPPVLIEIPVLSVLELENKPQLVNVQPDIMTQVKLFVNSVTGLVFLVLLPTCVLNVIMPESDLVLVVTAQKVGWMLKMVPLIVKKLITQKVLMT
jgi:hypothetical protein